HRLQHDSGLSPGETLAGGSRRVDGRLLLHPAAPTRDLSGRDPKRGRCAGDRRGRQNARAPGLDRDDSGPQGRPTRAPQSRGRHGARDGARAAEPGLTGGCNPPLNTRFWPDDVVTRGQMAAFLHRALPDLATSGSTDFRDDNGSTFESDIEWLAATGVTRGCNPPTNDRFCPDDVVTRGQMAAFLHRALPGLATSGSTDFRDDNGSTFESDIEWL